MRIHLLPATVVALALAAAPTLATAGPARPVAAHRADTTAAAPCATTPSGNAERDRYAARDCTDTKAQGFEGGRFALAISGGALLVVIIVVLILVL